MIVHSANHPAGGICRTLLSSDTVSLPEGIPRSISDDGSLLELQHTSCFLIGMRSQSDVKELVSNEVPKPSQFSLFSLGDHHTCRYNAFCTQRWSNHPVADRESTDFAPPTICIFDYSLSMLYADVSVLCSRYFLFHSIKKSTCHPAHSITDVTFWKLTELSTLGEGVELQTEHESN